MQVIAASSNLYIFSHHLEKRTWALIFGGVMCLSIVVPSFRNMRAFTLIAIVSDPGSSRAQHRACCPMFPVNWLKPCCPLLT